MEQIIPQQVIDDIEQMLDHSIYEFMHDVRQMLELLRSMGIQNMKYKEIDIPYLFHKIYRGKILYCSDIDQWIIYNGQKWEYDQGNHNAMYYAHVLSYSFR